MEQTLVQLIRGAAGARSSEMIDFARRLIATPSLSGEEGRIAAIVRSELQTVGFNDVWTDRAGSVLGVVKGEHDHPSTQFNTHLDHVDPGDHSLWPFPPYDAVVRDGVLYGRGACDVKGAMAVQIYAAAVLTDIGLHPAGDLMFAGVVLEEVGGFGSEIIATESPTDFAVIGEASENNLRRGHRGRAFVAVSFRGVSAHASAPDRARNPHFAVARFLDVLATMPMEQSQTFGSSSAAPTLIDTDQSSGNVTPGVVTIYLDWRTLPEETEDSVRLKVIRAADEAAAGFEGISTSVEIASRPVQTYTGIDSVMPSTRGFETRTDDALLVNAKRALDSVMPKPVDIGTWTFATDGGHLAYHGIRTIGFAPGSERFAHTVWDQVGIAEMNEALAGYAVLALTLGNTAIE